VGCGLWAVGYRLWAVGYRLWAVGCVPDARDGAGEAREERRAVGFGELQQVAGQDLRHATHLEGE
jgi:hypothetical protein